MKTVIRVLFLGLALVFTSANAQEFQGEATYKTQRSVDIKLDSTSNPGMTSDLQKQMQAMLKKQFQKTFTLSFNKEASIYKEEESLAPPQVGGSDMQVMVIGSGGGSDVLYKNTKNSTYTDQKDTMGKVFLVKDDIETIDWKLEKETKFIGQYQCFKATYVKMVPKPRSFSSFSVNEETEDEENKKEEEPEMIERTVTAWYTLQVPVNNGPAMYQGLPGLILEIHDGKLNIVCSKVVINPESKIEIVEPSKGKEVNREEYDKIMDKKRKEMLERFAPRNGRRSGESIEIRIGG
ncbi:GLPGLI family protein [Winogradskyella sp. PC-19]|uniref:GLPGLI family protein n=1 Tax=unclassified Winogradskyella TaxID=2615021 RepID=UPI000B3C6416|nr:MULTISPECIES: GLPGLI family protein [unclassified Winogradskyella]ARV09366.1 GLPGLI family protein [Winogradskyella sp. PC-19]RZN76458.1 MAG: GLPGLI family protein [Winogradskyella sp.]